MNDVTTAIIIIGSATCIAILVAAWLGLTKHGQSAEDWFRVRWGGSDAKSITPDVDQP